MTPETGLAPRREQRRAWRGTSTGRRATRKVETTYGRKQKQRDWLAARAATIAAATAEQERGPADEQ